MLILFVYYYHEIYPINKKFLKNVSGYMSYFYDDITPFHFDLAKLNGSLKSFENVRYIWLRKT